MRRCLNANSTNCGDEWGDWMRPTWFVRAVGTIAIVIIHGGPRDGTGSIETEPYVGRRGDIVGIQRGVDAFDLWAGGRLGRDGDGEGEQEG